MRETSIIKVVGFAMLLMVVASVFPASAEVTTYKINTDGTKQQVDSSDNPAVTIDGNSNPTADASKSSTIDAFAAVTYHYAAATNYERESILGRSKGKELSVSYTLDDDINYTQIITIAKVDKYFYALTYLSPSVQYDEYTYVYTHAKNSFKSENTKI